MQRLVTQNVSFTYDRRPILHDITLQAHPGQITVLMGPSGIGKSTLLWLLAGLLPPTHGQAGIAVDGQPPRRLDPRRDAIGMVFQHMALWDHLTAQQHLDLVLSASPLLPLQRRQRRDDLLSHMRLDHLRHRRPGHLSGGECQRLAIARALVTQPRWLLLDEPLAHLDGPVRGELFELLRQTLRQNNAGVIIATHNPQEALRLADQIILLLDGRIAQSGPPQTVYHQPTTLAAARLLGPASLLRGVAHDRTLSAQDGQPILTGISPEHAGPIELILRPESLHFHADPAGPTVVNHCEFLGAAYLLHATVCNEQAAVVLHSDPMLPGTLGRLSICQPRPHD